MAHGKNITRQQFHKIARDLKDNFGSVQQIADKNHISPESVRAIRRAKTWPNFNAIKEAKRTRDGQKRADEQLAQRLAQREAKYPEDQLQQKLDMVPNRPITPEYVQQLLDGQQEARLANENILSRLDNLDGRVSFMIGGIKKLTDLLTSIRNFKARRGFWKRG
ncbi:arginine/lysine/ornithine decarboxylase [Arthrobacter sp. UYCu511]|uniref:hypothetical protein n=1 Tax=Arthrobacter sp. UYCu511 TaxID=3156337 RepID=UPI00339B59B1